MPAEGTGRRDSEGKSEAPLLGTEAGRIWDCNASQKKGHFRKGGTSYGGKAKRRKDG